MEQIKNVSPTRAAFNKNEKPMKAKLAGDGANPDTARLAKIHITSDL